MIGSAENNDRKRKEIPMAVEVEMVDDDQPGAEIGGAPASGSRSNNAPRSIHDDIRARIEADRRYVDNYMRQAQTEHENMMRAIFGQQDVFFNQSNTMQFSNPVSPRMGRVTQPSSTTNIGSQQFSSGIKPSTSATQVVFNPQRKAASISWYNLGIVILEQAMVAAIFGAVTGALGGYIGFEIMDSNDWTVSKINSTNFVQSMTLGGVIVPPTLSTIRLLYQVQQLLKQARSGQEITNEQAAAGGIGMIALSGVIYALVGTSILGLLKDGEHAGFAAAAGAAGTAVLSVVTSAMACAWFCCCAAMCAPCAAVAVSRMRRLQP